MHISSPDRFTACTLLFAACLLSLPLRAAELVYVYSPGCAACGHFDQEIGRIYDRTDEATQAPITKIDFEHWAEHPLNSCADDAVVGTPTFIMLNECHEVDRIVGYSNDELFWLALQRMLNRLPTHGNAQR
jgi:hypothetical protein